MPRHSSELVDKLEEKLSKNYHSDAAAEHYALRQRSTDARSELVGEQLRARSDASQKTSVGHCALDGIGKLTTAVTMDQEPTTADVDSTAHPPQSDLRNGLFIGSACWHSVVYSCRIGKKGAM